MKLQIPHRKKNKDDSAPAEGAVFDLTGSGAADVGTDGSTEKKPGRLPLNVKFRRRNREDAPDAVSEPAVFGIVDEEEDSFEVNVRNSEPLIRPLAADRKKHKWLKDLQPNLASAVIVMAMLCLLLTAAEAPMMTLFTIPGLLVYLLIATLGSQDEDRIRRIRLFIAAGITVLLIASLIILRKYIGSGMALIMDQLYDNAEAAQAYVYDRFHIGSAGENDPERCMWMATVWVSILLGMITALPPSGVRRIIALAIGAFSMLSFAYYGMIPSWVCIAAIAAGLIFVLSRGSILSSLIVLVGVFIIFGAIMLIDPGENYGISRADENFRDRFALKSAFLENDTDPLDGLDGLDQDKEDQEQNEEDEVGFAGEHKGLLAGMILLLILAAIGAAVWVLMKRIRKRRAENRAGIDSKDPKEAITAMFPYAVRWLQPAGIDASGRTFTSLIPVIRSDISVNYADRYAGMYELWEEAAYSDHPMSEESRAQMKWFLNDTISMIKDRSDLRARIATAVRYAL